MPKQKIIIEIESDNEKNIPDFRHEVFAKVNQDVLTGGESGPAGSYSFNVVNS